MAKECKVCSSGNVVKVLDMGSMPNANSFVLKEDLDKIKSHTLCYYWCENCSFFQQLELIGKEELFGGIYTYRTGVNQPMIDHFKSASKKLGKSAATRRFAVVVASNDGTEISLLKEFGGFEKVIGVEPSKNLSAMANAKGLFTINDFFGVALAKRIVSEHGSADLVVANNVFAHIPNPKDMLLGMRELVGENGRIVIGVHWLKSLVEHLQIETLYGEHYFVWSIRALETIAKQCGLMVEAVEYLPEQHGGSIRVSFSKKLAGDISKFIEQEKEAGLYDKAAMGRLQQRAEERKKRIIGLVNRLNGEGKRVSIWTVPAKISTLVNFCGLTSKQIECAYDLTEAKIGRYIPQARILIKDENEIAKDMPDYLIVGAWNYIDFCKKKLKWYTDKGGKLINPLNCEIL